MHILDKNNRHPQNKHKRNISLSQQIEPQVCYITFYYLNEPSQLMLNSFFFFTER